MRRASFGPSILLVAAGFILARATPVAACHFGGIGCGPPEQQPFNPQVTVTLADNRTSAHSNTELKVNQQEHEQFPARLVADFPKEAGIDLDVPAFQEKIADLTIQAVINGAATTLTGRIKDHNEPNNGLHGHPSGGVYHWLVEIDSPTPGMPPSEADIFVDKNAADGHLHLDFTASADLIANAMAVNASLKELKASFFGQVSGGPFLTNPPAAGTYTLGAQFTAWDDPTTPDTPPTVSRSASFTIVNRVPSSVTLAPASNTLRVGNPQTFSVTVLDQKNEALAGAAVSFNVSGPNSSTPPPGGTTGGTGKVTSSYTGANGGVDSVTATATKFGTSRTSNTATITWREPKSLTLAPPSASLHTGVTHSVTATVKDQNGAAMAGESVSFSRSGANPGAGGGTTNASGQTSHSYAGSNGGDDTIAAAVQVTANKTLNASATAHWAAAATIGLSPSSASRAVRTTHTVTALVTDDQGNPQGGAAVGFSVSGANGASGSATTDGQGNAPFSYTGQSPGTDTITATADAASATATVDWTDQPQPTPEDRDGDGIINTSDNCPFAFNPDQVDNDHDGFGDACDNDDDNDSLLDTEEGSNGCDPYRADTDADGLNDWQEVKGYHTRCDLADTDGDGLSDGREIQTGTSPTSPDSDGDGVKDGADNCPTVRNADQKDSNHDGYGDACQPGIHVCVNGICTG